MSTKTGRYYSDSVDKISALHENLEGIKCLSGTLYTLHRDIVEDRDSQDQIVHVPVPVSR